MFSDWWEEQIRLAVEKAEQETAQKTLEEFICKLVKLRLVSTRGDMYYELLEAKDDLLKEKYGIESVGE